MLRARLPAALAAATAALAFAACGVQAARASGRTTAHATTTLPPTTTTTTTTEPPTTTTSTTTTTLPPTTTTTVPPGYGVGIVQVVLVNPNGYAYNYATGGTMPRTLVTEIRYPTSGGSGGEVPAAAPAAGGAPYPVVVFAHGYDVTPDAYDPLLDAWVRHGYVVVAPLFPDENGREIAALGGPGSSAGSRAEQDLYNEPSDLAYLLDTVAADARHPAASAARVLYHFVDMTQVVVAGQSDGAEAVAALAFDSYYSPEWDRLAVFPRLVASLSGAEFSRGVDHYVLPIHAPVLLVAQSATDECNWPQYSTQLYNTLGGQKWFLEIYDATHLGPYAGVGAAAPVMAAATADLFDSAVGRVAAASQRAVALVRRSGVGLLSDAAEAPPIAPFYPTSWGQVANACAAP